uniref:Leucine rich repeats and guanylate kinase domain containing n=1 Tax=Tetraodon nigroviridis TaxID=99883 RepID=H3CQ70_TETNG
NMETKKDGVLTTEMVSSCLSSLEHCGTGLKHTYHSLSLVNKNLKDISVLCDYAHLQKLEVPQNKIKDLSCISQMPLLIILDASHNQISDFFGFQPPQNLKEVNLSHNHMTKMKDLSAFCCLRKLDLAHNSLGEIGGLEHCCMLAHLNLAHNKISRISGLDSLPLTHLCLSGNQLKVIEGLENLRSLQVLDLSSNRISSLSGLQNLRLLCSINLERNLIGDIQECKHIHDLYLLWDLKLRGNPVQEQPDYRLEVVFLLQHLTMLDEETVTAEEKVSSLNTYDPPMELVAARDHMTHLIYQMMQPQVLYDRSTLPCADSPYPMLVLTGPQGCGKRELTHRLCQDLCEFFAYGICHTTRGPYYGEENGVDYHFINQEEFRNMIPMGKFIQTVEYGGHMYGLSRDAVEDVAREGLACCVHMELEGVLSLKKSYFQPRYILLIPTQVESYISRLNSRGLYNQCLSSLHERTQTCHHPHIYDSLVFDDDLGEAYQKLRQVMNEYLKIKQQEEPEKNNKTSPSNTSSAFNPSNLSYRSYFTRSQVELSLEKIPVELASIRRHEQQVRQAIVGKSPGVYSQLLTR